MHHSRTIEENHPQQRLLEEFQHIGKRLRPMSVGFFAGFALLFAFLKVWPLAATYLAGSLFYAWLLHANSENKSHTRLFALTWVWSVVFLESVCAVLLLGPAPGFQFYVLGTIPASFSSLNRSMGQKAFQGFVIVAFFVLCDMWWWPHYKPPYMLNDNLIQLLRVFNVLGTCAILARISHTRALAISNAEKALRRIATTDTLTGLLNRRAIIEMIEREVSRSARGKHTPSFLLCDIDHFKHINDTWGHPAGDHVLQVVANLLQGSFREYDVVARWGGEEFLIFLPDTDAATALVVGERLRLAVETCSINFEEQPIAVTLTIGVSQLHPDENWHTAIARADEALYQGKKTGRNRVSAS